MSLSLTKSYARPRHFDGLVPDRQQRTQVISTTLHQHLGFYDLADLVTDYAEKLDPALFEIYKSRLPFATANIRSLSFDASSCFNTILVRNRENLVSIYDKSPPLLEGAKALKITPNRKLFTILRFFSDYQDTLEGEKYRGTERDSAKRIMRDNQTEMSELAGMIEGVEIIKRSTLPKDQNQCYDYVFNTQSWFLKAQSFYSTQLLGTPDQAITLLIEKGYTQRQKTEQPASDDVVVYCCSKEARHYGFVDSVTSDKVTVISKWGDFYIYRHLEELVPYFFGNQVFYFKPPQNT